MKEIQLQIELPGVPKAKQGREIQTQWEWTEAAVWTERMLATLEGGIKGGKWFSLIDKVWKLENLQRAVQKVAKGKSQKKSGSEEGARHYPSFLPLSSRLLRVPSGSRNRVNAEH